MREDEPRHPSAADARVGEQRSPAALSPTGGQPLILYDLATLVGAAYQQRITLTRQQRVVRRVVDLLRPRLHGRPRADAQGLDASVGMLCSMAVRLGVLRIATPWGEDAQRASYRPAEAERFKGWTQWHAHEQARAVLAEWRTSPVWQDLWSADFELWDPSNWNALAARRLLLDLLRSGYYEPERWYLVAALLEEIWSRGCYFLRPRRQQERRRTQDIPSAWHTYWERCERLVYVGILASTLSELGIVSLATSPSDFTTGPLGEPTRWKLTDFGAQVFSLQQGPAPSGNARRVLVVQPSYELILLEFTPRVLYQLLPLVEVVHLEQASRLRVTRASVLRGIEHRVTVEQMLAILHTHDQHAVPQNVVYTMHDWAKDHKGAHVNDLVEIVVTSEAVADELYASPRWRLQALQVSDSWEFRRQLQRAGIMLYELSTLLAVSPGSRGLLSLMRESEGCASRSQRNLMGEEPLAHSASHVTPARRKRLLTTSGPGPAGDTQDDLGRSLDWLYGTCSHVCTRAALRQIVVSDPCNRSEHPRQFKLVESTDWREALHSLSMPPSQERLLREWWRTTANAGLVIHARPSEKGKCMNSISTDSYRFELTAAGLLITTVEDTVQMNLSPGEALLLDTFIGGAGRREARRQQRRLEREGFVLSAWIFLHGFKTSTHRFEYLGGCLSIFDVQSDAQVYFDPYHVIRVTDFIRGHRRRLMHMPQDPVVPEYFP